ncbi:MAG: M48 family metallopeptidase [bacterium]
MSDNKEFRKHLVKYFSLALLAIFLIPLIGYLFTRQAQYMIDKEVIKSIQKSTEIPVDMRDEIIAYFRTHPLSSLYDDKSPRAQEIIENFAPSFSTPWQFHLVEKVSFWTLLVGGLVLIIIIGLGALAFTNQRAQYQSFVVGWRLLTVVSACELIIQGLLALWLSFWLPAFYMEFYSIRLIAIVGIFAATAIVAAVVNLFKHPPVRNEVEGELLTEADSPGLWARINDLATRVETKAPDNIIAGIDANFFVTESPLKVAGKEITGRSLYVSIPLLRLMDKSEADAVFVHELGHLQGGDTAGSALLAPKLAQYDHYMQSVAPPACYLLIIYRIIFELALQRDSRECENRADRTAASISSPSAIITALIKLSAYDSYRNQTESKLFENKERFDGTVGIANTIAIGLVPYATSDEFVTVMKSASIPHPFNSHPPISERMKNVGYHVDESEYGKIVTQMPAESWVDDMGTAAGIEERLWNVYEQKFAAEHEKTLAYRYEPANEEEQAIVLKYFPPVAFSLKGDKRFLITYAGFLPAEDTELISWDRVYDLKYEDGMGSDILTITFNEKAMVGLKTRKVKLPGIKKEREQFKAVLGKYWRRHQIMRKIQYEEKKAEGEKGV